MRHGMGELLKSGMARDYKEVWGMVGSMVKLRMRELLMTRD